MGKKIFQAFKVVSINTIILFFIFAFLEIISRLFFSEFNNEVHQKTVAKNNLNSSGITRGLYFHTGTIDGKTKIGRVPTKNEIIKTDKPLFVVLGDSITHGHGLAYQDIYWHRMQRMFNLDEKNLEPIKFIGISGLGNNISNSELNLKNLIKENKKIKINHILYQFNFNDITPYKKEDIKEIKNQKSPLLKFSKLRYKYLNRSTFLRLVQFYASSLTTKRYGSCSERGLDALGPYTWSYAHKEFKNQSLNLWNDFENQLKKLNQIAKNQNATFSIFISPLIYDIDNNKRHPYFNKQNLDFSCSTINPKDKLFSIANRLKIKLIDPSSYLKFHFNQGISEGNFKPFFFPGDENHFNEIASEYVAEYLYFSIFDNSKR